MAILTESYLLGESQRVMLKGAARTGRATIFLSHSHLDRELARGFIGVLASQGVSVWVDWNDTSMPRITSAETARTIKRHIQDLNIFAVLATKNAMQSRWVPWEIGIADKTKGEEQVLIVPVADPTGKYQGNEYMQLYRHFELDNQGGGRVVNPDQPVLLAGSARAFLQDNILYG